MNTLWVPDGVLLVFVGQAGTTRIMGITEVLGKSSLYSIFGLLDVEKKGSFMVSSSP